MDIKIYSIEQSYAVPETQSLLDALYNVKIASGEWHEDTIMGLKVPRSEGASISRSVREATDGQEWDLTLSHQDMTGKIRTPIVSHMYLDYLDTDKSDYLFASPIAAVMTPKMVSVFLNSDINAVTYPIAVLERALLQGMSDDEIERFVEEFDRGAHVRYQMLHLLDSIDLFDPERSDDSEKTYALADPAVTLPPFFRVNWGPITSLLTTEEGKTRLEAVKLLGVKFEPLQIIG